MRENYMETIQQYDDLPMPLNNMLAIRDFCMVNLLEARIGNNQIQLIRV